MPSYTGTNNIYDSWLKKIAEAVDLSSDTFKILLATSSYVPNQSSHAVLADISGEVSGNGYARQTLGSVTFNQAGGIATFDFADAEFVATTGPWTAHFWVIFDDTPAEKPLICYGLLNSAGGGTEVTVGGGNFLTFNVNASGLFRLVNA